MEDLQQWATQRQSPHLLSEMQAQLSKQRSLATQIASLIAGLLQAQVGHGAEFF